MESRLRGLALLIVAAAAVAATLAGAGGATIQSAPTNSTLPSISGGTVEGSIVTASSGSWNANGSGTPTFTYQFESCNPGCSTVTSATTTQTYQLQHSDIGNTIRVLVVGTNSGGTGSAESPDFGPVTAGAAPSTGGVPTISGTLKFGYTLTETDPTWTGTAPITHHYQWEQCDSGGGSCTTIGTDAKQYTLASGDVGHTIRVVDNASNAIGSSQATSTQTAVVQNAPPTNTASPVANGTAAVGQNLSLTSGTWTGTSPITYTYQWRRCDTSGNNCSGISGATSTHYTVTTTDSGHTIRGAVTASNVAGSSTSSSNAIGPIPASAPANTVLPAINGTPTVGGSISVSTGTWTGVSPITFTYQWQRCDTAGNNCVAISGATRNNYNVATTDAGSTLRAQVTGTNTSGTKTATSNAVGPIASTAPVNTAAPVVSGTVTVGQSLTVSSGTWSGATPITYAYEWQRCTANATVCTAISGANRSTYLVQGADAGIRLRAVVTATNHGGSTPANSNLVGPARSILPRGAVRLANGSISVPVKSLTRGDSLHIPSAKFSVKTLVKRRTIRLTVKVTDNHAYVISGATVSVTAAHSTWVAKVVPVRTGKTGFATLVIHSTSKEPLHGTLVLTIHATGVSGITAGKKVVKITLKS